MERAEMIHRAVCFVIMPFGRKPDASGQLIDFDAIYRDIVAPAIDQVGLAGIRADDERGAGIIHKLMYERLILSEFAIADLTITNANVYYELGVRHAARPSSTVLIGASSSRLPFDVGPLRTLPYDLDQNGMPVDAAKAINSLVDSLRYCRQHRATDSPLFELLVGYKPAPIDHEKTDVFRQRVAYSQNLKERLRRAREDGATALDAIRDDLGELDAAEAGVAIDLLLSYRAISQWDRMLELVGRMDATLKRTVMVREQTAFALNRLGRSEEAERILKELIAERGPSSETYGLLGRVYKDRWKKAYEAREVSRARGVLKLAIAAYRQGFEADWRDAYPGVNALTLMAIANPRDPEIASLVTVVRYAVERRLVKSTADYWDYATLLELAVIEGDFDKADEILPDVLAASETRDPWELRTTVDNLTLLANARTEAKADVGRLLEIMEELSAAAAAKLKA